MQRRCLVPDVQWVVGVSLRGQTGVGWRGFGAETTRSALDACLFVDTYADHILNHCAAVSQRVELGCFMPGIHSQNTKHQDTRHDVRGHTRGSQHRLGRLGPTPSAAHSARLFAAPNHNSWLAFARISGRRLSPGLKYIRFLRTRRSFRFFSELHHWKSDSVNI